MSKFLFENTIDAFHSTHRVIYNGSSLIIKLTSTGSLNGCPNKYDSLIIKQGEGVGNYVITNSDIPFSWCWYGLSQNPNVTWDMIHSEDDEYKNVDWNNYFLCMNPNVTIKVLKENPQFHYYQIISKNKMDYYPWHLVKSQNSSPYILK